MTTNTSSSEEHIPSAEEENVVRGGKRTRGPAMLSAIESLKPGQRILVPLNEINQPVEKEGGHLSAYLGVIAKKGELLPIEILDWHHMPNSNKENALHKILEKFELPLVDPVRSWIIRTLCKDWRNWKYRLRQRYIRSKDKNNPPKDPRVIPQQWHKLKKYWDSDEFKGKSVKNIENRKLLLSKHHIGQKSFARLAHEHKKQTGIQLDRSDLYVMSRTGKDGTIVDPISQAHVDEIHRIKQSQIEDQGSSSNISDTDILRQVLGKESRGRVRCLGLGPTPTQILGRNVKKSSSTHYVVLQDDKNKQDLDNVKSDVGELKTYISRLDDQLKDMKELLLHQTHSTIEGSVQQIHSSPSSSQQKPLYEMQCISCKITNGSATLAKGLLLSEDPHKKIWETPLGLGWCEVVIKVVVDPNAFLLRPYGKTKKVEDALGSNVAWPRALVELIPD